MTDLLHRQQLTVCLRDMVNSDFPDRWPSVVDKISIYLQNPDRNILAGALSCLYKLVKCFE